jgi:transcriptional regulator with XRE-family HTH domain
MREYLRSLRENKKMTQEQIAAHLGINANYYCMIENGDRQKNMSLLIANKLSKVLNVPLEFIVQEEEKLNLLSAS